MKKILISLFLFTCILTATEAHHNKNRGHGFRSGRKESSLEERDSEVESCDDFCTRRERERLREQDDQRACEQQKGKNKCKSSPRRILGIPGLLPPLGKAELHRKLFPLPPFIRSKRSPKHERKHGKGSKEDRGGSSNRQRESDCECDRRMMSTSTSSMTTTPESTTTPSKMTPTTTMMTTPSSTTTPESTTTMSTTTSPTASTTSTTESTTTTSEPTTTTTRSSTTTTRKRRRELDDA